MQPAIIQLGVGLQRAVRQISYALVGIAKPLMKRYKLECLEAPKEHSPPPENQYTDLMNGSEQPWKRKGRKR